MAKVAKVGKVTEPPGPPSAGLATLAMFTKPHLATLSRPTIEGGKGGQVGPFGGLAPRYSC